MEATATTLQWLNLMLTSGVLVTMLAAGIAYGRLTQKVEDHGDRLRRIEEELDSK